MAAIVLGSIIGPFVLIGLLICTARRYRRHRDARKEKRNKREAEAREKAREKAEDTAARGM